LSQSVKKYVAALHAATIKLLATRSFFSSEIEAYCACRDLVFERYELNYCTCKCRQLTVEKNCKCKRDRRTRSNTAGRREVGISATDAAVLIGDEKWIREVLEMTISDDDDVGRLCTCV